MIAFIISSVIPLLLSLVSFFGGVDSLNKTTTFSYYDIKLNPLTILVAIIPPILSLLFIQKLYKNNDSSETVKNGTALYFKQRRNAIVFSILSSFLIAGLLNAFIGNSLSNLFIALIVAVIFALYAWLISIVCFSKLTEYAKENYTEGSLTYWPTDYLSKK